MIPDAVIEEVRGRVDVVAVIGRAVELKRSGRTWKGCCPFHGERTPSFHVYPEDKHFKCYGCGEGGDVFKFLQKLQGKEFPEVVRQLAAEVGVEIPDREEDGAEQRERRRERKEALAACDAAARYFAARLASEHGAEARRYLEERGTSEEMVRQFRLGVAGGGWNDLAPRMVSKGVGEAALKLAGLVAERDGGRTYDRFRGRLMFPIAGLDGEVIGFGGRVLPGRDSERLAKYINSPESPVYKKSRVLYGIDLAREAIRKTRSAVLVEGYFDVIGLHQVGVKNAVAVCGTALTPEHLELLARCDCREVVALFDGDAAGAAAPARAAQAILPSGISGKVAILPSEQGKVDPDEFARANGRAAVEALLASATPLTDFLIERAVTAHCDGAGADAAVEQKLAAVRELRPFLTAVPAGLARSVFEERAARKLAIDPGLLAAEVEKPSQPTRGRAVGPGPEAAGAPAVPVRPPPEPPRRPGARAITTPAVDALGLLASFPGLAAAADEEALAELLPAGPAEVVRALVRGDLAGEAAPARLEGMLSASQLNRVRELLGPARPEPSAAERELRRAVVKAKVRQLERRMEEVQGQVARAGSPAPAELVSESLELAARFKDMKKRLSVLERG
ncbi:MAG TPA: DNA primase [Anaeromyxobacteraceae bacterium]|jgi:DNA primase|nr:DNA primase [Anaeromyxobacteraceae bacterium]